MIKSLKSFTIHNLILKNKNHPNDRTYDLKANVKAKIPNKIDNVPSIRLIFFLYKRTIPANIKNIPNIKLILSIITYF